MRKPKPPEMVIYRSLDTWKCTNRRNYDSTTRNSRDIYILGNDLPTAINIVKRDFGDNYTVIQQGWKRRINKS